jgi:hypothetical protein
MIFKGLNMGKNLLFLAVLVWAANSMAKSPKVHQETVTDSTQFKVERPVQEKEGRFVAGEKKKKGMKEESKTEKSSDSEVRYWQYQE